MSPIAGENCQDISPDMGRLYVDLTDLLRIVYWSGAKFLVKTASNSVYEILVLKEKFCFFHHSGLPLYTPFEVPVKLPV